MKIASLAFVVLNIGLLASESSFEIDKKSEEWHEFLRFKITNFRIYKSPEAEIQAFINFNESYNFIKAHNLRFDAGLETFRLSINQDADKSEEYYENILNKDMWEVTVRNEVHLDDYSPTDLTFLNYTDEGLVNPVRTQGRCGACWGFAMTCVLEGQHFLATNELEKFSEQQLIDCTRFNQYGNLGCIGGRMSSGYDYVLDKGAMLDSDYKYRGKDNPSCMYNKSQVVGTFSSYNRLPMVDAEILKRIVAEVGPVAASINAMPKSFQFYDSGVYSDTKCDDSLINHAVCITGFGNDPIEGDYWILKNSYGQKWGEGGYMRMARNKNNICGIYGHVSYAFSGE